MLIKEAQRLLDPSLSDLRTMEGLGERIAVDWYRIGAVAAVRSISFPCARGRDNNDVTAGAGRG